MDHSIHPIQVLADIARDSTITVLYLHIQGEINQNSGHQLSAKNHILEYQSLAKAKS